MFGVSIAACSSDDGSGAPTTKVKDKLGRSCTITAGTPHPTCDQPPAPAAACKGGATACYDVGTTGDAAGPGAICAACCSGNTSTSVKTDCSNITCSTNDDCPSQYGRCVNGECRY